MKSHDGFTLVEIVVALLVLSVGLLSTVSGMALAARMVAAAGERTGGGVRAVGQLELWVGTACGGNPPAALTDSLTGSWTAVSLGNSVESATVVTVGPEGGERVHPDTFTVTGGCR